jgi:hypothetical protein
MPLVFAICTFDVGHDPEAVSLVRCANGASRNNVSFRVIPERGQRSENSVGSSSKESCDVFHDDESRSYLANDPSELVPKTGPCSCEANTLSGNADVLAWEAAADDIDAPLAFLWRERPHVFPTANFRPVLGEHGSGVWVDFYLPLTTHSGSFKSKVKTSNACKK